jgi:hypothetical protein
MSLMLVSTAGMAIKREAPQNIYARDVPNSPLSRKLEGISSRFKSLGTDRCLDLEVLQSQVHELFQQFQGCFVGEDQKPLDFPISLKELCGYTNALNWSFVFFKRGHSFFPEEDLIKLCLLELEMGFTKCPIEVLENFSFKRIEILSHIALQGIKHDLYEKHYDSYVVTCEKLQERINTYLQKNDFPSQEKDIQTLLWENRWQALSYLKKFQTHAYFLHLHRNPGCIKAIPLIEKTIQTCEDALKIIEILPADRAKRDSEADLLSSIVGAYCACASIFIDNAQYSPFDSCIETAKKTRRKIKNIPDGIGKGAFQDSQRLIENTIEQKTLYSRAQNPGSDRLKELRSESMIRGFRNLYKNAEDKGFFVSPFEAKRIEYIALFHEYEAGKRDSSDVINAILEVENVVSDGTPLKTVDLYQKYLERSGGDFGKLYRDIRFYISSLVADGQLDMALDRAKALLHLSSGNLQYAPIAQWIVAQVELFSGNPEPYRQILESLKALAEERKEQALKDDSALKEKQKIALKKEIASQQAENMRAKEQKEMAAKKRAERPQKISHKPGIKAADEDLDFLDAEILRNQQEEAEEKKLRHQAAEERRRLFREAAEELHAQTLSEEQSPASAAAAESPEGPSRTPYPIDWKSRENFLESIAAADATTLKDLCNLKGAALKMDHAITQGQWNLTKKETMAYFEALGCTHERDHGSHAILVVQEVSFLKHGDEFVGSLNMAVEEPHMSPEQPKDGQPEQSFGGSLVLPPWTNKNIPEYMKKQILQMRERIRAFKLIERHMEKALNQSPAPKGPKKGKTKR